MKLKDALLPYDEDTHIRIFSGPHPIFNGKKAETPKRTWNMRVHPYMDCTVLRMGTINNTITIII